VRFWDVIAGAPQEEMPGDSLTLSEDVDKQTAGNYLVTNKGDLLLVHLAGTAGASKHEKAEQNKKPMAFLVRPRQFPRAPAPISTIECANDKIAVRCTNGEALHLRAPFLVPELSGLHLIFFLMHSSG